jgi:predicted enzyme related to lactoylglutathione lyase
MTDDEYANVDLGAVMGSLVFRATEDMTQEEAYEVGRALVFYGALFGWTLTPIDDSAILPPDGRILVLPDDDADR